eukprot:TRINITY_DN10998_c0_g1_i1.p2 TRINITY_DN10998_c0_g1~~TRINITY_DN10998_c0_g1_i1.p2  ORF type:complete len:243 (-),score=66.85 TRINITY_DN10998_c0_g1_i1:180-908(-)
MSAQDPFYLVKEEIQESVNKVSAGFARWEGLSTGSAERDRLTRELESGCESVEWQVDELEKAINVAERDPARFNVSASEIESRRQWTSQTRKEVERIRGVVKTAAQAAQAKSRQELMRGPAGGKDVSSRLQGAISRENDAFLNNESDRQQLLMREQDEDLDELERGIANIGNIGKAIHDELSEQDLIMDELDKDMTSTSSRLDFVQKKMANVIKKAGVKGQICMIVFLLVLFIVLVILVFET